MPGWQGSQFLSKIDGQGINLKGIKSRSLMKHLSKGLKNGIRLYEIGNSLPETLGLTS